MQKIFSIVLLSIVFFPTSVIQAQELYDDEQGIWRAKVIQAGDVRMQDIYATGVEAPVQNIEVRFIEGPQEGKEIEILNEFDVELAKGDVIFVQHWIDVNQVETYVVFEVERSKGVAILFGLFALLLIAFGGMQGFRALIALVGSILAIVYILVPAIFAGYSPILVSIGVATVVLSLALFFTHGFNKTALAAFLGTVMAVIATGLFAWFSIEFLNLSGVASEDEVYLNFNTGGTLDFVGLLLGAIIIGVLGALDDIAITQAATVRELYGANKNLPRKDAFVRAMRVGKEHVTALVNTLVLAYTGAALPLLLLFLQQGDKLHLFNLEIFTTEIVRMIVGSIGLILAVPLTTLFAVWLLEKYRGDESATGHAHVHHH